MVYYILHSSQDINHTIYINHTYCPSIIPYILRNVLWRSALCTLDPHCMSEPSWSSNSISPKRGCTQTNNETPMRLVESRIATLARARLREAVYIRISPCPTAHITIVQWKNHELKSHKCIHSPNLQTKQVPTHHSCHRDHAQLCVVVDTLQRNFHRRRFTHP